jgi:2-amino-4-hydroxy-6-hydroxymethyldihydropteridine diphosphokinase
LVLIGVGSNQGDSLEIVKRAISELERFALPQTFRCSRLWRTSPVDCPPDSGMFLNAAVGFEARENLTPELLLRQLKDLERQFGRGDKVVRNAPRELDLDLLVFDEETRDTETFTLPHPRAVERLFVLAPVAEIAPELGWPGIGKTVRELLLILETDEQVTALDCHISSA